MPKTFAEEARHPPNPNKNYNYPPTPSEYIVESFSMPLAFEISCDGGANLGLLLSNSLCFLRSNIRRPDAQEPLDPLWHNSLSSTEVPPSTTQLNFYHFTQNEISPPCICIAVPQTKMAHKKKKKCERERLQFQFGETQNLPPFEMGCVCGIFTNYIRIETNGMKRLFFSTLCLK